MSLTQEEIRAIQTSDNMIINIYIEDKNKISVGWESNEKR